MRLRSVPAALGAVCAITVCGTGSGGAFGTVSWSDPAEEIAGVIMLQQPYGPAIYDFENAVRQAIID